MLSKRILNRFTARFPETKRNASLRQLTTFGVGARSVGLFCPKSAAELVAAVKEAKKLGLRWVIIAGGSNVVFPDRTWPGVVICYRPNGKTGRYFQVLSSDLVKTKRALKSSRLVLVEAAAQASLQDLINWTIKNNLAGLESLSGIPGSVGGAIVGNAGAYGQCISDHLDAVQVFNPGARHQSSSIRWIRRGDCQFSYRESVFKRKNWLVLGTRFRFAKGNKIKLVKRSREIINLRSKKYKPGLRCPGSFFKNVLLKDAPRRSLSLIDREKVIDGKIPAGYLIQAAGFLGRRSGGAIIASFHGNLIINQHRASFADVKRLAEAAKRAVKKRFQIDLQEEVRYMV